MNKMIYRFGGETTEGDLSMKDLLGGKGANLAEMSRIGLPVPPGFTISTELCQQFTEKGVWPAGLNEQIKKGIEHIEQLTDSTFGAAESPLLVSVRSGAAISMPGMMDTILNLGLNDETVEAFAKETGDKPFAYECYRRLITMFGNVVMGLSHDWFEGESVQPVQANESSGSQSGDSGALEASVEACKAAYRNLVVEAFPQDPWEQLERSAQAVFRSWNTPRARTYRQINAIRGLKGTAVNVQAMVFGNKGGESGTGVCFSRNPATGENGLYGEFLLNAQGEDIVAGVRTPQDIDKLKQELPDAYVSLQTMVARLEEHFKNMQDIEFTIERGTLHILQTRNGKRTGKAAVKIAVDMVQEGLVTEQEAVRKLVEPFHLETLLHSQLKESEGPDNPPFASGLAASPGAAVGRVVFSSEKAFESEESVILVRIETSSDDVQGMSSAAGILTSRGGKTSHAAVVARGWGKPCVAGAEGIRIDYKKGLMSNGEITLSEGDWISIDGTDGVVYEGKREIGQPDFSDDFYQFMEWVDRTSSVLVRANADTPQDAERSRSFGAAGIGLCRTEHMFFGEERIRLIQKMIFSRSAETRKEVLDKLFPFQKQDFLEIYEVMGELPVTIRLLDPPLHEFLPDDEEDRLRLMNDLGMDEPGFRQVLESLQEHNPMLGHRGCRLGITIPEITEMQTRAIMEAALERKQQGVSVEPEIMIPLVGSVEEFRDQKEVVDRTCQKVFGEYGITVDYQVGTMIEVPRAAILADEIAECADFFSFGTNDLTQMTFGFSRDDTAAFMPVYLRKGILQEDPFQSLDQKGVGALINLAVDQGRKAKKDLKIGVCGEHGGDPQSIGFFISRGFDYVSCSPFRIPVARLAVAQAVDS
ncbi:MAG: pyruvate, phosphate dikinase [Balneolaceae bacterium]